MGMGAGVGPTDAVAAGVVAADADADASTAAMSKKLGVFDDGVESACAAAPAARRAKGSVGAAVAWGIMHPASWQHCSWGRC